MREKTTRRWLSLLLTVVMVLSLVPATALAAYFGAPVQRDLGLERADAIGEIKETLAGAAETTANSGDGFYKIVHLDCGRKYFSPANIKKIIDNAAAAGFNQVELYLSDNQGFRFALDDMKITTSTDNTYDLAKALGDGYSDGSKFPDGSGKYLTQSEMSDIISYAAGKSIEIVPCINVPGHMGAILEEFPQFRYSGSQSSIDLENEEAVAFALAITEKYATYFASQGVKYYNLGADEYANDMSTMGFQGLYTNRKYSKFVDFLNSAADIVIEQGMTPRTFNDGICYNNDTNYKINKAIQVCYWSNGWSGYNVASAATLQKAGYELINTHGDYYWVLGNTGWQCSAEKAAKFDYTVFQGNDKIDPAGAMFCIWCDNGAADGQDDGNKVVSATADVIAAFGGALPASTVDPEPEKTIDGAPTNPLKVGDSVILSVGEPAEWTSDNENVISLSEDPSTQAVSGTSSVTATAVGAGSATITAETATTIYTADIKVLKEGEPTDNRTITVTVDQTATDTIEGANYAGNYTTGDPSIATVIVTGQDATEGTTTYSKVSRNPDWTDLIDSNGTQATNYYYLADETYYQLYVSRSSRDYGKKTFTLGYYQDGADTLTTVLTKTDYALNAGQVSGITMYTQSGTAATPASTTVTFTGKSVGTTQVTVGNVQYTINVLAEDLSKVTPLTVEYWITNMEVTAGGAKSKQISAEAAYGEEGVELSTLVPESGSYTYGSVVFWKGTVLDQYNKQTTSSGVANDKTGSGEDFSKIRYWNSSWQYYDEAEGTWTDISSTDQVVAYWLQPTEVTPEITTLVKDWGYPPDAQGDENSKVALTIAVVYPDGTVSPAEGAMYTTSTTLFNYWDGRNIGLVAPVNNSDYEISKITVTDGTRDQSGTGKWGENDTITWEKVTNEDGTQWYDETIYWEESDGGTPMVNGATQNVTWSSYNTAKLVLIYLKPVHYDTNLIVNWVDDSANGALISTMEVAVSSDGTPVTFYNGLQQSSALPTVGVGGTFTLDDDAYITNSSNVNQTFNKNISTVPNVAEQYKSGLYKYVSADLSADGKTLTLHYTIDTTKLSHTYVLDFGLDVAVPLSDLVDNPNDVSNVEVLSGNASYDESAKSIVVTPSALPQGPVTVRVRLTLGGNTQSFSIGFIPASNVLYEDNFLTVNTKKGTDGVEWTAPTTTITDKQSSDQTTLYGHDTAYADSTSNSMGSAWTINKLPQDKGSQYLTTSFYGTGFDLIGTAGPDTGYVYLVLQGPENKLVVVDTSYVDGKGTTLSQVPLAHLENLKEGTYTVNIRAAYRAEKAADSGNSISLYSANRASSAASDVYAMVEELYMDGFEIDDVEFVYFDESSALAKLDNAAAATYSLNSASAAETNAVGRPEGTTVTIDGFRVYRSSDNDSYIKSERNVTYVNVLDATLDGGSFKAYTENGTDNWTQDTYEAAGGPQNEVYLDSTSAIAFKVNSTTPVQISARVAKGSASLVVNGDEVTLNSNTEMYYTVTPANGIVTIKSNGDGLLALGNLKLPEGVNTAELTEEDQPMVFSLLRMAAAPVEPDEPEEPEVPVFQPAKLDLNVTSANFFTRKIVTLSITASSDVAYLTVNGKRVEPTNALLVKWGLAKNYLYVVTDTVSRNATAEFAVVAYDANGVASEVYVKQG